MNQTHINSDPQVNNINIPKQHMLTRHSRTAYYKKGDQSMTLDSNIGITALIPGWLLPYERTENKTNALIFSNLKRALSTKWV